MTTYFVSTTGLDSNPGTQLSPFLTLGKGLRTLAPGDTLYFRGGTYSNGAPYGNAVADTYGGGGVSYSGGAQIRNFPGETVQFNSGFVINGNVNPSNRFIRFEGDVASRFIVNNGILINNAVDHIRLNQITVQNAVPQGIQLGSSGPDFTLKPSFCDVLNSTIQFNGDIANGNQNHGIYPSNTLNLTIDGNYFFANAAYGIHLNTNNSPNKHDNLIVRNNRIEGRKAGATGSTAGLVFNNFGNGINNIIYNNIVIGKGTAPGPKHEGGLQMNGGTSVTFANNTIYDVVTNGIDIFGFGNPISGVIVRNCIFYLPNGGTPIHDATGTQTIDHNVIVNPLFVNPAIPIQDFHLTLGSPAINTGVTIAAVTTDFDGVTRPQGIAYDIGAYEFGGDVTPPAIPTGVRILP